MIPLIALVERLSLKRLQYGKCKSLRDLRQRGTRMQSHSIATASVSDEVVSKLAAKEIHALRLTDLIKNGRPLLDHHALYNSANFSLSILPSRLAHRIQALRSLPYIVVANPYISQIHQNYVHSLSTLLPYAESQIRTQAEENNFTEVMSTLVQTHASTIPTLARGFLEARNYVTPKLVTEFLDEHLRARIGTRLIAEQHLALHNSFQHAVRGLTVDDRFIGIIDTMLSPARVVEQCEAFVADVCELTYGVRPWVIINGHPEATIIHIPVHLEYILTELLKNSFRASIEKGSESQPIEVTIAPTSGKGAFASRTSFKGSGDPLSSHATNAVTIRIRDRGGGISPDCLAKLWEYGFTTFDERQATAADSSNGVAGTLNIISGASAGGSTLAGLGYGLPLGRAYAEYFGGSIMIESLFGWGTDVYLSLKGINPGQDAT